MRGTSRHVAAFAISFACACGTGDTKVDPGDLELRDLLGVSPDVASKWDVDQRASARRVLLDALDRDGARESIELADAPTVDDRLARSLSTLDARRFAAGDDALAFVRVTDDIATIRTGEATEHKAPTLAATAAGGAPPHVELVLSDRWGALTPASEAVLAALAVDGGYRSGTVVVTPEPRLAVVAAYSGATPAASDARAHLVVNPVLLAAIDPEAVALVAPEARATAAPETTQAAPPAATAVAAGNPYSFYGSIAECAYAQRLRCESCLPSSNCKPVTTANGNDECTKLAENDGRGYFLLCINLALAITSVDSCTEDAVSGCPRVTTAADDLNQLEANASFLADSTCSAGLDGCLAKIYGASKNPFPGIVDGGVGTPPPDPPRNTDVSCGDSCSSDNNNCEASPSCSGPSCNNSLSCDSTCSSSNNQSGCGDNCDSCGSDDTASGGGGGGGGGSCGGDSSSGSSGGGCGGSCGGSSGGGSSGGSSGGGCGGDSGGCGGGGGGCGGDSSNSSGGCGGGGGGGGCGGGGGGGGGCQVTKREPSAAFAVAFSLGWAFLPIPVAAAVRRRSRKRRGSDAQTEVKS